MLGGVTDSLGPRVLFCAFAEVPGATAAGTRMAQWLSVFGTKEMDALSLKGRSAVHLQRFGGARMMRVPNTEGRPLPEGLATYQRALQRQMNGENYHLVWCADLESAASVAPLLKGVPLILEVADQWQVGQTLRDAERVAFRAASKVLVPSRPAAKLLSERVDARRVQAIPRCVDRSVFRPPSVEISLDEERLVLLFGGRESDGHTRTAVALAQAMALTLPSTVRIGVLGTPGPADVSVRAALASCGLTTRVELIDVDGNLAVAAALTAADVVVVPTAEGADSLALPNRALEAMACGRAVVVIGPTVAFEEGAAAGQHFVSVPARDPRRVAEAIRALLADAAKRSALGRAASRHIEHTADLMSCAQEVQQLIAEATGVCLTLRPPRGDQAETSSKSAAPRPPVVRAERGGVTRVVPSPNQPPPSGEGVFARVTSRRPAPAPVELPATHGRDLWAGDTSRDEGRSRAIAKSPDAARVRDAMLLSSERSPRDAPLPTSVPLVATLLQRSATADQWAPDTIADGTPLSPLREPTELSLLGRGTGRTTLLVDTDKMPRAPSPEPDTSKLPLARASSADEAMTMEDRSSTPSRPVLDDDE